MPGPTAFPQILQSTNTGTQSITTTTETVIATLNNINSKGQGYALNISGSAVFAIQAATTAVTMRLRVGSLTGILLGPAQVVSGGIAGDITAGDGTVGAMWTPTGEVANATLVLTIQATAAAANWNVTYANLQSQQ